MAKIFKNLMGQSGIDLQIYSQSVNRRPLSSSKATRKAQNMPHGLVNAILYGSNDLCDPVGEYLGTCGIFLQDPVHNDRDVLYRNPQLLAGTNDPLLISQLVLDTSSNVESSFLRATGDIFAEISSDDHLSLTEAPDAVNTELYR